MPEYYSGSILDNHQRAIEKATDYVKTDLFYDGEFQQPANNDYFETTDPAVGEPITEVARGQKDDIDAAVQAAKGAAEDWADTVPAERQEILGRLADRVRDNLDEFTLLESLDSGKPLDVAEGEIKRGIKYLEYYAGLSRSIEGKQLPYDSDALNSTVSSMLGPFGV